MKIAWYLVQCRPDREPHSVAECDALNHNLPDRGFVREYRPRPDAPDPGPVTLREYWIQAFSASDALERWKKAAE
jgi:hypothetical protein